MRYELYYWPHIPGRGELLRLSLDAVHRRVGDEPRIAAYLASPRRVPFNDKGIFRHYPELDP